MVPQNELCVIEMIHFLVECLDKHFGNVCELDILFHLDEVRFGEDGHLYMQSVVPRQHINLLGGVRSHMTLSIESILCVLCFLLPSPGTARSQRRRCTVSSMKLSRTATWWRQTRQMRWSQFAFSDDSLLRAQVALARINE